MVCTVVHGLPVGSAAEPRKRPAKARIDPVIDISMIDGFISRDLCDLCLSIESRSHRGLDLKKREKCTI